MSLTLVLLPLLACLVLAWRGRRRPALATGIGIGTVAVLFALGTAPVVNRLLASVQDNATPATAVRWFPRSAILLPGMGTVSWPGGAAPQPLAHARINAAARAWRACTASGAECLVLVSGGAPAGGAIEAEVYAAQLQALGVPPRSLVRETAARSTWDNARLLRPHLERWRPDGIFLVTSGVHMPRARRYFRHFGMPVTPIAADRAAAMPGPWPSAYNLALADAVFKEYEGMLRYRVYNALGRNPAPLPALPVR